MASKKTISKTPKKQEIKKIAKVVEEPSVKKSAVKAVAKSSVKKTVTKKVPGKKVSLPVEKNLIEKAPVKNVSVKETMTHLIPKDKKISKSGLIVLGIIIVLAILYIFRSSLIVAFVNGQPITRAEFNHDMELSAGKQALNDVVTQKLIFQEANKRHITVSDKDVNAQIKSIQTMLSKQGLKLDQALASKGMTMSDLTNQIKLQKMLEMMLGDKTKVTDKDVEDYIAKNQDSFKDATTGEVTVTADMKNSIRQQLQTTKVQQLSQDFVTGLQKNAKINYFVQF